MDRRTFEIRPRIEGFSAVALILIIIVGGTLVFSIGRVGVGYVSIVVDPLFGSTYAVGDGSNARYFFKPPWASVYKVYVATDSVNMWSDAIDVGDFPAVQSLTKDGLRVDVDITVRWRVVAPRVVDLFRRFPALDWRDRAIIPIIREAIRNLIVDFTAIETIEKRGVMGVLLEESLREVIVQEESLSSAIDIEAVNLRRITLPDNFVNAIESKLASEQLSIAAEFNKTRILVLANASAQSNIIVTQGKAKSQLITANATRQALEAITELNPEIDRDELTKLYLYLQTLQQLSESGKATFIVTPGDSNQFIVPIPP